MIKRALRAAELLCVIILSAVFIGTSFMACRDINDMVRSHEEFKELSETVFCTVSSSDKSDCSEKVESESGISALIRKNSECIGWISIPGTVLSYPVMYTPNAPQKYLHRNFYGKYSASGVPFLDSRCSDDSTNLIIYGHCMKNGTMFRTVRKYSSKAFWSKNKKIEVETPQGKRRYIVFAAFKTTTSCGWYNFINAESPEEFEQAISEIKTKSIYDTGVTPQYGDRILTLSTCCGSSGNGRFHNKRRCRFSLFWRNRREVNMPLFKQKSKVQTPEQTEEIKTKDFFDCIVPGTVKFMADHYIVGDSYRCVWAVREYPPATEEQAVLSQLADRNGVTLRIYNRPVGSAEQRKIIQNAARKNKLMSGGNDVNEAIEAEGNLQDVVEMLAELRKNKEPLLHCAVYIELKAKNPDALRELQSDVSMELTRSKISVDRLTLRQKEGFLSVMPMGFNRFGAQFERVLPASSAANLYPFNFSGKTDPCGLYLGRDKYGSNVLADFDRRAEDKTNGSILILGNSGQGKSYLLKLILTNIRESGKCVICLDPEAEYEDLTTALGGCYVDFMSGRYTINPLEPKAWTDGSEGNDDNAPEAFRKVTRLSQHIAFLKDFFRAYKDFTDAQIDTIEVLLSKLYSKFGISDYTDYSRMKPEDFPLMSDFYALCEEEFMNYDIRRKHLYTEEMLQEVCLGIHSMCVGAESRYFNGHTNIADDRFLCFGVKGLMDTNKRLKDAMLFNILSFMSNRLLGKGSTVAAVDELYLFLSNMTAIEYIRNCMKRVRKKDSSMILASQNIEDFLLPSIKEFTKPLFSIPTHRFLFNPGQINPRDYMDTTQTEESEYELIKIPCRGTALYCCGNERYLLMVKAPTYKSELFGKAGGR